MTATCDALEWVRTAKGRTVVATLSGVAVVARTGSGRSTTTRSPAEAMLLEINAPSSAALQPRRNLQVFWGLP